MFDENTFINAHVKEQGHLMQNIDMSNTADLPRFDSNADNLSKLYFMKAIK